MFLGTLLADYAHFQNKNSLNIHIFYQTKELLNNNSLVIRRVINEKNIPMIKNHAIKSRNINSLKELIFLIILA